MRMLCCLVICLSVAACAASKVASFRDPSASANYGNLIVVASNLPLEQRIAAENKMVESANGAGVVATAGMSVFPPTREQTAEAMNRAIVSTGAEAVLLIWAEGYGSTETYVPPTVISPGSSTTTGTVTGHGGFYNFNATTTYKSPTVLGGYTVTKPRAQYGAALYDTRTGQRVWIADISSRGNSFADYTDLALSAAGNAIKKLSEDGLIGGAVGTETPQATPREDLCIGSTMASDSSNVLAWEETPCN